MVCTDIEQLEIRLATANTSAMRCIADSEYAERCGEHEKARDLRNTANQWYRDATELLIAINAAKYCSSNRL